MKILHILRSRPDALVQMLVSGLGESGRVVPLEEGGVDYDALVADIFECEKVICWW
jgi:hypothetical protein